MRNSSDQPQESQSLLHKPSFLLKIDFMIESPDIMLEGYEASTINLKYQKIKIMMIYQREEEEISKNLKEELNHVM